MVRLIRELVVLPLRLLLLVCRFIPVADRYAIVKWVWRIGRRVEDGWKCLGMTIDRLGIEAGRDLAHEMLNETKSASIVYVIARQENERKNYDAVKEWIDLAEEMECEDLYHTLIVKFFCSYHIEEYDRDEITDEILALNYLPAEYTREALISKAGRLIKKEKLAEAEKIVDHMLCIKEGHQERFMKGMLCLYRDEDKVAVSHFSKARGGLPDNIFYSHLARTYLFHGREQEGMEWLLRAVSGGYDVQEGDPLQDLAGSDKYAAYCARMN